MQIAELRERVVGALLRFAGDQWAQMGVFVATERRDSWAQDPEALLVFTLEVARADPRLFDEVLDWLRANGDIVSARRLSHLSRHDPARPIVDAAVEWAAANGSTLKRGSGTLESRSEPVPLFRQPGLPGREDPIFLSHGFVKPVTTASGKSTPPDLQRPINLAFRLRRHFGVSARAEIVRFLLTTGVPNATALAISAAAASTKRNVSDALAELSTAGDVERFWVGNEARYGIDRERWASFLGLDPLFIPAHRDWPQLLRALAEIRRWLDRPDLDELSDYLRASEARQLMRRIEPDLLHAGVATRGDGTATDYWPTFVENVETALAAIASQSKRDLGLDK